MSNQDSDLAIAPAPVTEPPAAASHPQHESKAVLRPAGTLADNDLNHWKTELDGFLASPGEALSSRSADDARPWATSLFDCLCPADLCLLSFCCPCVVFGKTHHRVNKRSDMRGYEPVNVSCLLFFGTGLFGFQWIFEALQRAEMRRKYNLEGSCVGDLVRSCCCSCCLVSQLEKEAEHREKTSAGAGQEQEQYRRNEEMVYPEIVHASGMMEGETA